MTTIDTVPRPAGVDGPSCPLPRPTPGTASTAAPLRDCFGHPLSTTSLPAATAYLHGAHRTTTAPADAREGAHDLFAAALAADPGFDLARAALALTPGPTGASVEWGDRAPTGTRRERQHAEVLLALSIGDAERGLVLAGEHLEEFPLDVLVAHHALAAGLRQELVRRLARAWWPWAHDPQVVALLARPRTRTDQEPR